MKRSRGFTLIELLVASGLFVLVFFALSGALSVLLSAQRQALLDVRLVDSARFAMDSMARTLRTVPEQDILDPPENTNGARSKITFVHRARSGEFGCPPQPEACEITYEVSGGILYEVRRKQGAVVGDPQEALPLTASTLQVEDLRVILEGRGDCEAQPAQPRVTIALRARDEGSVNGPSLPLATTVTLRPLEVCLSSS